MLSKLLLYTARNWKNNHKLMKVFESITKMLRLKNKLLNYWNLDTTFSKTQCIKEKEYYLIQWLPKYKNLFKIVEVKWLTKLFCIRKFQLLYWRKGSKTCFQMVPSLSINSINILLNVLYWSLRALYWIFTLNVIFNFFFVL